jgi:hypothetical protein
MSSVSSLLGFQLIGNRQAEWKSCPVASTREQIWRRIMGMSPSDLSWANQRSCYVHLITTTVFPIRRFADHGFSLHQGLATLLKGRNSIAVVSLYKWIWEGPLHVFCCGGFEMDNWINHIRNDACDVACRWPSGGELNATDRLPFVSLIG